ncbi:MAG: PEP-CTERM sorting domain-containing protein [Opitutaceae bacterium]|jgi:hypothetical protein|nr:PEP-CTERM sorting domain-containing protein [Opitutaceae bacterium]
MRIHITSYSPKLTFLLPAVLAVAFSLCSAQEDPPPPPPTFTFSGATGNWDQTARWSGGVLPTAGSNLVFSNRNSDRVARYRNVSAINGLGGQINSLTINQTMAFSNVVELWRSLTVAEAITLEASGGGSSVIRLLTSTQGSAPETGHVNTTGPVLIAPSVTLNGGGRLELGKIRTVSGGSTTQVNGDVNVSGGTLSVQRAARVTTSVTTAGLAYTIDGNVSMTSGLIEMGVATSWTADGSGDITNTALKITGDLTLTGGRTQVRTSLDTHAAKIQVDGALTYGGELEIYISPTSTTLEEGATYALFTSGSRSGTFSSVALSGFYDLTLTGADGVWTGSNSDFSFTFSETTGSLVVGAVAVPEPATVALLGGLGCLLSAVFIRRSNR